MEQGKTTTNLQRVLETQEQLKLAKGVAITFSKPILLQESKPLIYPNTINVIQGQAGVHKSRLAETMCSALLKLPNCKNELLGIKRENVFEYDKTTVVYVDTERNLKDQFPYALQSIQTKAGFLIEDNPANFQYISLLPISRKERFTTLNDYLNFLRKSNTNHLFIVLDVSTDCIEDFNKTDKSMELIDLMNIAINEHNVTFLCLIHENPKSDKARGHLGTEIMNKSSTVIQVGYEKEAGNRDSNIICIKYLKCRSTEKHPPFYAKYSSIEKGLILATTSEISEVVDSRKQKADLEDMRGAIENYLGDGAELKRKDLLEKLMLDLDAKEKTIEIRIKELLQNGHEFFNSAGKLCTLSKLPKGKEVYYRLTETIA